MNDAVKDVLVTRTPKGADEFLEYMTSDAGGWSTNEKRAFRFSQEGAGRTLCELRQGQEKDHYLYDKTTVVL